MHAIALTDGSDPRLDGFRTLTDRQARHSHEAATGTYIAESFVVLERAIAAGHVVIAVLAQDKWVQRLEPLLAADTPVYVVPAEIAEAVTGFAVHRGVMAVMQRPAPLSLDEALRGARTVVVADDITDHTNMGSLFRAAAALNADAVLLSRVCADPLYRRSVRVSMGTVFALPWARAVSWPLLRAALVRAGFEIVALALTDDAVSLREFQPAERVALVVGTEGDGLSEVALAHADHTVMIPMREGVDSLNVAAAASVALWAVQDR
ncbi:RNA methyltransferase [Microbacterium sp. NC79]|uniref:TrmH family RNA methyltransferase n=1 Tax=Microbacterium sp. NC79 TaxID=2851009 RepID=UPI001C2C99B0|nr:RNA methyltransferase [Microbacterium sp. NC79]MBV0894860.1 RNA methyltransferase [Microbacterium sp. NC79]